MSEEIQPIDQPPVEVTIEAKKSLFGKFLDGYVNLATTIFSGVKGSPKPQQEKPVPSKQTDTKKPVPSKQTSQKNKSEGIMGDIKNHLSYFSGASQPAEHIYDHSSFYETTLKLTLEFYDETGNKYDVKESFPKHGTKVRIDEPTGNYLVIRFTQVKIEEKEIPLG